MRQCAAVCGSLQECAGVGGSVRQFATYCRTLLRTLDCAHGSVHTLPCAQPYTAIYSGSMQQASCGSMLSNSLFYCSSCIIYLLFIIYSLFSVCCGSMLQAFCTSCQFCLFIYYLFIYFINLSSVVFHFLLTLILINTRTKGILTQRRNATLCQLPFIHSTHISSHPLCKIQKPVPHFLTSALLFFYSTHNTHAKVTTAG